MLVTQNRQLNNTFERIIRDKNGVLFRIRFIISGIDGELKPHIISVEALGKAASDTVVALPCKTSCIKAYYNYKPSFFAILSPLQNFDFFMSQPTRAPSL